jgi:hypothetical protein
MTPEPQSNTPRRRYLAAACLGLAAALLVFYVCYLLLAFSPRVDHWLPGAGLRLLFAGLAGLLGAHLAAGAALSRMKRMPGRTGGARLIASALEAVSKLEEETAEGSRSVGACATNSAMCNGR